MAPSQIAIGVSNVSKKYQLGQLQAYQTLGETLSGLFSRRNSKSSRDTDQMLWALKNVSLDIGQGEVVGVIGHNGAGKSTLLKILSRITEPTSGEIVLNGRVGSLLEVGTGFHPELTGRENIYLNGSILGMRRSEINRKLDEIIDFSGVEKFLDTPVKRYSSGMQVRLAFAVAAHLEPEILIVDEVLAVGDAEFQRKCLGKMDDVARSGRTVVFVSHNMAAVENLCSRAILLKQGKVLQDGETRDVIAAYMGEAPELSGDIDLISKGDKAGALRRLRLLDAEGTPGGILALGKDATFEVSIVTPKPLKDATLNIRIDGSLGQRICVFHTHYQVKEPIDIDGAVTMSCQMRNCRLMPGMYFATLILKDMTGQIDQKGPVAFQVAATDVYGTGRELPARTGNYVPEAHWRIEHMASSPDGAHS